MKENSYIIVTLITVVLTRLYCGEALPPSGVTLLFSGNLFAGSVGDVTKTGTGTGHRQRKRGKLRGDYIAPHR